ncbi:Nucleoporin autopeptidase [Parelaphostrongylus tenuis]|uniref:Nuclear pore complex protein Nup98-Nup96 n=1 Tax=Parelaphostrongylus tenuis TaxID=148309 RepID=A0AAD5LWW4_PARTN|nr:Nucleoporin autopeptidase [Parelaphostrongylus tenuis]
MFGKSTFGSTSSTFGSPTSSLFGQNKPTTGLFGQQNTTGQGSLFGQKSTTNLFGQSTANTGSSIFGSTQTPSSTGTSLFGQSKPSLFGSSTTTGTTSLFGNASSTGSGLFGSTSSTVNGTTIKFEPLVASDTMMKNGTQTTIQTKHMCITAMKAYEGKSLEELRIDDYIANRKAPTTTSGLFGSSTSTNAGTSIFGSTAAKPSLFGSSTATSSPFGSTTQGTSLFGQNNNASQGTSLFGSKPTGSIFGSPATSTSTFGSTGGGLFGSTAGGSTFGTNQPQQTGSLFGGSSFGSAATTSSFTFGSTTNTTSTPFGQTGTSTTGGLFGSNPSTSTGGLFGKPAGTTPFSFGSSSNTAFGQTSSGGGLFGNAQKPGGLFGSTNTTGGLFGSQPTQQGTGLFGSTQPTQSLFGSSTTNQQAVNTTTGFGSAVPTTINVPAAAPIVLGSDVNQAQVQMALLDAQIAASPYGDCSLLKLASAKDSDDMPNPISAQRQLKFLAAKSTTSSPLNMSSTNGENGSPLQSSQLSMRSSFLPVIPPKVADTCKPSPRARTTVIPGRDINYTSNVAPPTLGKGIRTKSVNGSNSYASRSLNGSLISKTVDSAIELSLTGNANKPLNSGRRGNLKHLDLSAVMQAVTHQGSSEIEKQSQSRDPDELPSRDIDTSEQDRNYSPEVDQRAMAGQRGEVRNGIVPRLQLDGSSCEDSTVPSSKSSGVQTAAVTSSSVSTNVETLPQVVMSPSSQPIVRLNSPDYFTDPTINAMREMVVDGKVILNNGLTVGRATYGSVFWPGSIELENLILDEMVVFRHKEVTVYPDESKKPPLGEGLNRPAEITLERVWPVDRETKEEIRDALKLIDLGWRDRLEKITARMGATFKDYRPTTGSWVFRVEHFSKYGLPDNEGDSDTAIVPNAKDNGVLPPQISACDIDTSMEEQSIQAHVQRAKVKVVAQNDTNAGNRTKVAINGDAETAEETELGMKMGLGGKLDLDYDDNSVFGGYDLNFEDGVPCKKLKTEEVLDYVYEESKRLMELSTISTRHPPRITLKYHEPVNVFHGGIEVSKTVGYKKSTLMNLACARGTSSRVSWSQGGQFAFSMQPSSNEVQVSALRFDSSMPEQLIVDMLEHNVRLSRTIRRNTSTSARVRHSEIEGETSAPRIKPAEDAAPQLLDSFLATATQSECIDEQRVWRLCQALFPSDRAENWLWQRTQDVRQWLCEEVASKPPRKEVQRGTAAHIWSRMCCGDADGAAKIATEGGMTMLSLMISTALSLEQAGQLECSKMVEMWKADEELGEMPEDLIKIFVVLAGKTHTKFVHKGKTRVLNCLEGLDWQQAFGIHLWYINWGGFLEDAVESFCEDVNAGRAASPESHVFEQLIRLACSPGHQVEAVLDAAMMLSPNLLDAHLSWHLWSLLRALGYNTMSPAAEQRLHTDYSSLLTACGQWPLAVFVLSHISHDQCRSLAIRQVLERMSITARSQDYDRILAICDVPVEWISAAKLIKAKAEGNFELACEHALAAKEYATALRLFTEEVRTERHSDGRFGEATSTS